MNEYIHLIPYNQRNKIKIEKKNPLIFNLILFVVFISLLSCFLYYKYKQKNKLNDSKNIELLIATIITIFFIVYIIL